MKSPPNTTKRLKEEAEKLCDRLFRGKYCVVHFKETGRTNVTYGVEKHHLIERGKSSKFKFNIWNIVPICADKHRWSKLSAHEAKEQFMNWVKDNLPKHWKWFQEHRYEPPRTLYDADWAEICDDLRHYLKHPHEAEVLIYEKDF